MNTNERLAEILAKWKVERDGKCDACAKGLALGAHGCHFEDDTEESYSVGNCKAWPLSNRIRQIEVALSESSREAAGAGLCKCGHDERVHSPKCGLCGCNGFAAPVEPRTERVGPVRLEQPLRTLREIASKLELAPSRPATAKLVRECVDQIIELTLAARGSSGIASGRVERCQAQSEECGQCELCEGHEGKHLAGYLLWGAAAGKEGGR